MGDTFQIEHFSFDQSGTTNTYITYYYIFLWMFVKGVLFMLSIPQVYAQSLLLHALMKQTTKPKICLLKIL